MKKDDKYKSWYETGRCLLTYIGLSAVLHIIESRPFTIQSGLSFAFCSICYLGSAQHMTNLFWSSFGYDFHGKITIILITNYITYYILKIPHPL